MKNFICPYCNHRQGVFNVFKIKPNQEFNCEKCNKNILPKFNSKIEKNWNKTIGIGIISSYFPTQISLFFKIDIFISLLVGFLVGLIVLISYTTFVYKTTFFLK